MEVLETTGPLMLTQLYNNFADKEDIIILEPELFSPFTKMDVKNYIDNTKNEELQDYLDKKLEKAVAVHYFIGVWL